MDELLAARLQMALSLGFHIIFACIGMVMPFLMCWSEWRYLRTRKKVYKDLAMAWSKGVAIFFAVGAVSGTVLSFELGMLWPGFMEHAGAIIGMPFSLEGTAFFLEAIALGLFLYGWNYLKPIVHWLSGLLVGLSGLASGILVVAANGWMNAPSGFDYANGVFSNVDPIAAMFNTAWFSQALHMVIASFIATGFAVAGVHAIALWKNRTSVFHRKAIQIAMTFAIIASVLQPISGDISAKFVAKSQPAKLAAMEAHFHTEERAGLWLGGIPDVEKQEVNYGIQLPGLLSFLVHGDFKTAVPGLDQIPKEEWPPVLIVHFAFQIMVGLGMLMLLVGFIYLFLWKFKKHLLWSNTFLILLIICIPFGFIAIEAGWIVTEVGRQPWIIQGIMKTKDALTPMPGIQYSFYMITVLYLFLSIIVSWLMYRQIKYAPLNYSTVNTPDSDA